MAETISRVLSTRGGPGEESGQLGALQQVRARRAFGELAKVTDEWA